MHNVPQDVFTRGGKFLFLYKRPGRRVIVNDGGHMMVAPSAIEASVQQYIAGAHVHILHVDPVLFCPRTAACPVTLPRHMQLLSHSGKPARLY